MSVYAHGSFFTLYPTYPELARIMREEFKIHQQIANKLGYKSVYSHSQTFKTRRVEGYPFTSTPPPKKRSVGLPHRVLEQ